MWQASHPSASNALVMRTSPVCQHQYAAPLHDSSANQPSTSDNFGIHLFHTSTSSSSSAHIMAQIDAACSNDDAFKLLDSQKFTDFAIRCDGHDFSVHRVIIYYKSEYFRAVLDSDFREKVEGVLELKETTPAAVAAVVLYCYINNLVPPKGNTRLAELITPRAASGGPKKGAQVSNLLDVYLLSDRLLLKDLSKKRVETCC